MRLLLDTNVFIWWFQHKDRVGPKTRAHIIGAEDVSVSVISGWEIAVKGQLRKLNLKGNFMEIVEEYRFSKLPLTFGHLAAYERLPLIHRDPFDRMLVLQAMADDLILVSGDRELGKYPINFMNAQE